MREHPLLMQGPLVRATLEGRKTQTRRPVRNQPPSGGYHLVKSPLGEAGDRLWVRETWARPGDEEIIYRADKWAADLVAKWKEDPNYPQAKWTPSIHMPRWACRLVLPLVSVRVERVQDITEEDAKAEGVERIKTARDSFRSLWISIYGQDAWDDNPWVWVAEWKEIEVRK